MFHVMCGMNDTHAAVSMAIIAVVLKVWLVQNVYKKLLMLILFLGHQQEVPLMTLMLEHHP